MSVKDDINAYISFVLYAVIGRMGSADQLLGSHGPSIRRQARRMAKEKPVKVGALYRGILLDGESPVPPEAFITDSSSTPEGVTPGRLVGDEGNGKMLEDGKVLHSFSSMRFVSHTESRDVANWFASPNSSVSGFVSSTRPDSKGYVIVTKKPPSRILWHHSWRSVKVPNGDRIPLHGAMAMHPELWSLAPQFKWNVETQQEVIVEATSKRFPIEPLGEIDVEALDAKLTPPGVEY